MGSRGVLRAYSLVLMLALLSVLLMGLAPAEDDAQWPMSYYDKGNTNSCPYDAAGNDGELLWSHYFQDTIGRPVIGSDGTLYVTTGNDLVAISSEGEELWMSPGSPEGYDYSRYPLSAAIGRDGCIYYATGSENDNYPRPPGGLYAVWPNGTLRWSERFSAPVLTAPRIDTQGNVLIVVAQWMENNEPGFSELRCYDEGGDVEWAFSPPSTNGSAFSEPAISPDGTVCLLTSQMDGNASLWAISPIGDELWNKSIPASSSWGGYGDDSDLSVSIDLDGSLYLAVGSMLHALSPDGLERWNYSDIDGWKGVAIGEGRLFVVDGPYLDILGKDGEWIATYIVGNDRDIDKTPIVLPGDNAIILTDNFGDVQIINANGTKVWSYPLYQMTYGSSAKDVVVDEQGSIYITTWSETIIVVGERGLQADILAWDVVWVISIVFTSIMLLLFIHSIRSDRKGDDRGQETKRRKENKRLGKILRGIGCALMLSGLLGTWALYGLDMYDYKLFGVFNLIEFPIATLLAFAYSLIILLCACYAKWGIAQFVVLVLITAVMLLSDPLQTVQGAPNDGWVPQLGFVMAWLGTGLVLLSGRYYAPGFEVEEPVVPT